MRIGEAWMMVSLMNNKSFSLKAIFLKILKNLKKKKKDINNDNSYKNNYNKISI